MSKQGSYQKLKAKNQKIKDENIKLELQIHTLITKPGSFAALHIKAGKKMGFAWSEYPESYLKGLREGGIANFIKESSQGKHPSAKKCNNT